MLERESFDADNDLPTSYPGYWVSRVEYEPSGEILAFHIQIDRTRTHRIAVGDTVECTKPWESGKKLLRGTIVRLVAPTQDTLPVYVQLPNDLAPERFKIMEVVLPK